MDIGNGPSVFVNEPEGGLGAAAVNAEVISRRYIGKNTFFHICFSRLMFGSIIPIITENRKKAIIFEQISDISVHKGFAAQKRWRSVGSQ